MNSLGQNDPRPDGGAGSGSRPTNVAYGSQDATAVPGRIVPRNSCAGGRGRVNSKGGMGTMGGQGQSGCNTWVHERLSWDQVAPELSA
jgi:hypothetical protein